MNEYMPFRMENFIELYFLNKRKTHLELYIHTFIEMSRLTNGKSNYFIYALIGIAAHACQFRTE